MRTALILTAAALCGCMAESQPFEGERSMMVFRAMELATAVDGVSPGFNLDGLVSGERDAQGCRQDDYLSPSGSPGIDNQLSDLIPLLDLFGEGALQAFVQNAIDEGRLLVMPELVDLGSSYELTVYRGDDQPLLGTDGRLLDHQTLAMHQEAPVLGVFEGATLEGGVLRAGPFELLFPVVVFELLYQVQLSGTLLEITFDRDGIGRGVLAGSTRIEDLRSMAVTAGERADADIVGLVGPLLEDLADMDPDRTGACRSLSLAATFETVPAYTYPAEPMGGVDR